MTNLSRANKNTYLQQIHNEMLSLKTSPLYKYRTSNNYLPVIGEGDSNARILFIGEAPGRNEAKTGLPFCGAAEKSSMNFSQVCRYQERMFT